jgi:hypothetical protein
VRISVADPLHPACARAGAGSATRPSGWRACCATPRSSWRPTHSDWLRLHSLAGEALRERLQALPAEQVRALHARAATGWPRTACWTPPRSTR